MKRYKVIQCGTGNTGRFALRRILEHPQLELVGVWVHSADKEGRDAGELCRRPACGVRATRDMEGLLRLPADCVSFMAADPLAGDVERADSQSAKLFEQICRFLAAGKNVVATAPNALVHPPLLPPGLRARLEGACRQGGTSFHYAAVSPGFMPDKLVATLTALSGRIDRVVFREIANYGGYDSPETLFGLLGFGLAPSRYPAAAIAASFRRSLGGSVRMIADALALPLDAMTARVDCRPTETAFDIRAGRIEAGTVAAMRVAVAGVVAGEERITVEHLTRIADDVAPDWPRAPSSNGEGYRIEIHGVPSMAVDLELGAFGRNTGLDAGFAVGAHVANAIPVVCEAPCGVRSFLDLPPITGAHAMSGIVLSQ
jgi:4-hydroxy-tetrahydrodipicolinate reductase